MTDTQDWGQQVLALVQLEAVKGNQAALEEAGRRYALVNVRTWKAEQYKKRIAASYSLGLAGHEDPYAYGRGGNFTAGLRDAWWAGKRDREACQKYQAARP